MAVAAIFLAAYAAPIVRPELSEGWRTIADWAVSATWVAFVVDYVARLTLSESRTTFVRRHLFDLAVVALPMLRPLRLLRLVTLLSFLQRRATASLFGRTSAYIAGGTALLVLLGGLAITDAERGQPGANIDNVGDGLWWAFVSITTVGYGDFYPTTTTGRLVAVGLTIAGIGLVGSVTGMLASWFVQRVGEIESATQTERSELSELRQEILQLKDALTEQPDAAHGPGPARG